MSGLSLTSLFLFFLFLAMQKQQLGFCNSIKLQKLGPGQAAEFCKTKCMNGKSRSCCRYNITVRMYGLVWNGMVGYGLI
jgi:hypothetical protein